MNKKVSFILGTICLCISNLAAAAGPPGPYPLPSRGFYPIQVVDTGASCEEAYELAKADLQKQATSACDGGQWTFFAKPVIEGGAQKQGCLVVATAQIDCE